MADPNPNEGKKWEGKPVISDGQQVNFSRIAHDLDKLKKRPKFLKEIEGYREDWAHEQHGATRHFLCPWGLRTQAIDWILGYSYSVSAGVLKRLIPEQHPQFPWLYASSVEVEGKGATADNNHVYPLDEDGMPVEGEANIPMIAYYDRGGGDDKHSCHLTVRYTPRDYQVRSDEEMTAKQLTSELERFVVREPSYGMKEITLPIGQLKFTDDAPNSIRTRPVDVNAGRVLIATESLKYMWLDVPDPPLTAIEQCMGRCNASDFDGARGWQKHKAETMLMLPPQLARHRTVTGRVSWNILYLFAKQPRGDGAKAGWNAFIAADGRYYQAEVNGKKVFQTANFDDLFKVPAPADW